MNKMEEIYIDKVVLNIGIGQNEQSFEGARALLEKLTGHAPSPTKSRRRDPSLKLRKGQTIGAMVTLRNGDALDMLKRAIDANNNVIKESSITNNSLSFGIKEYIDFTGVKYDPKIGMLGMNVNASFARKGKRVALRRRARGIPKKSHSVVRKEEIIKYLEDKLGAKVVSEQS